MPRRKNGPGAFLISLGIVLLFTGLMTFLAIPAARKMDEKHAELNDEPVGTKRQRGIVRSAWTVTGIGATMTLAGLVLARKKR